MNFAHDFLIILTLRDVTVTGDERCSRFSYYSDTSGRHSHWRWTLLTIFLLLWHFVTSQSLTMHSPNVDIQVTLTLCNVRAEVTWKTLDVTKTVNSQQVSCQRAFTFEHTWADVTPERLDVTNTVHSSHVQTHALPLCELPAAEFTRVLGVRMLWSWRRRRSGVARSMRRLVVSADRWLVAEHHRTELTLDSRRPHHL